MLNPLTATSPTKTAKNSSLTEYNGRDYPASTYPYTNNKTMSASTAVYQNHPTRQLLWEGDGTELALAAVSHNYQELSNFQEKNELLVFAHNNRNNPFTEGLREVVEGTTNDQDLSLEVSY